jgi:hypothetical protein
VRARAGSDYRNSRIDINRETFMTKREKLRKQDREYKDALREFQKKRKPILVYEILDDGKRSAGSATYDTETDTVDIKHYSSSIKISGDCLRSLRFILDDLLSEVEQ